MSSNTSTSQLYCQGHGDNHIWKCVFTRHIKYTWPPDPDQSKYSKYECATPGCEAKYTHYYDIISDPKRICTDLKATGVPSECPGKMAEVEDSEETN
jgi:hypothetical protein